MLTDNRNDSPYSDLFLSFREKWGNLFSAARAEHRFKDGVVLELMVSGFYESSPRVDDVVIGIDFAISSF